MVALSPFEKLRSSLSKTKDRLFGKISQVVLRRRIDDDLLDEIEEILIEADIGVPATVRLLENLRERARSENITEGDKVIDLLKDEISKILARDNLGGSNRISRPQVWLIVGVNGVGKTTTIGKLAALLSGQGHRVMIAACDTFRAAAIDQIAVWAERSGVDMVRSQEGSDPASVAFDAASAARARGVDYLLVDTAGRLHTKANLMEELSKIRRVILKALGDVTIFTKLIIDGSTGQNALSQVTVFKESVGCDALIVTKLDGTAKGGVLLAIAQELNVPVEYIGIGEGIEDLQTFNPEQYAEALFS